MQAHGNRANGKRWRSVLLKRIEVLQAMEKMADSLITEAMTGNMQALKEIGDRIDGKALQGIEMSGMDGEAIQTVSTIRIVSGDGSNSPATS